MNAELEKWIDENASAARTFDDDVRCVSVAALDALFDGKVLVSVEPDEEWRKQWEPWQLKDGMVLIPISELKRWRNVFASDAHPYQSPYAADIDKVLAASQELQSPSPPCKVLDYGYSELFWAIAAAVEKEDQSAPRNISVRAFKEKLLAASQGQSEKLCSVCGTPSSKTKNCKAPDCSPSFAASQEQGK